MSAARRKTKRRLIKDEREAPRNVEVRSWASFSVKLKFIRKKKKIKPTRCMLANSGLLLRFPSLKLVAPAVITGCLMTRKAVAVHSTVPQFVGRRVLFSLSSPEDRVPIEALASCLPHMRSLSPAVLTATPDRSDRRVFGDRTWKTVQSVSQPVPAR